MMLGRAAGVRIYTHRSLSIATRRMQGTLEMAAPGRFLAEGPPAGRPRSESCYMDDAVQLPGVPSGPLSGLRAVVKDSYDVAGWRTSNGSPAWRASHGPAAATAPAVHALIQAGVTVVGKTVMDEMAYSLQGENAHYGAPVNPAAPGRVAGGSSSGSAAAVAAGDAEIGLGGDTGGSVRVPASYCGIFGMRPTHGRVSLEGSCPLAPSFDTGGWFARDASVLRKAGAVLLQPDSKAPTVFRRWLVGADAFALADAAAADALHAALVPKSGAIAALLAAPQAVEVGGGVEGGLREWFEVFRTHQAHEAWAVHGSWITSQRPALGPGIKERFEAASQVTNDQFDAAVRRRAAIVRHLNALLGADGVLIVPAAPGPAPKVGAEEDDRRQRLITLTCISGLGGLPQVSVPLASVGGCPVGLGLIGPRGSDEALLELAETLSLL